MKNYFFTRNLLSVQVSYAISNTIDGDSAFIVESLDEEYFRTVASNYPGYFSVSKMEPVLVPKRSKILSVILFLVRMLNFFIRNRTKNSRVFVTYPLHLSQSVYLKIFRILGAEVHFFEEGSCFYKDNSDLEDERYLYSTRVKSLLIQCLNLDAGYRAVPDVWHSVLNVNGDRNSLSVKLNYEEFDASEIRRLFLSRPLQEDFGIGFDIYINAIKMFAEQTSNVDGPLYIKFHPRESKEFRDKVLRELSGCCVVKTLESKSAAENVVYSMKKQSVIGGFETATLVYANAINDKVRTISMLRHVKEHDCSGILSEYYDDYSSKYDWIEFL